jgi:hypothetical protein
MADQPESDRQFNETKGSSVPGWLLAIVVIVGLVVAAFAFDLINIDQVSPAKAPVFDVSTAKVDLGKTEKTVKVPTIDVGSKDETVTVPTVDVEPAAKDK